MLEPIPIIDVFAGPGGLGEGFSSFGRNSTNRIFKIGLSVEKDSVAHSTLELRSFFRQFNYSDVPEDYYEMLRGRITRDELFDRFPMEANNAKKEAWCAELGSGQEFDEELDRRISNVIGENDKWVLIGGPPCQAYSVIGRARVNKENDSRNYLYLEYMRIIAKHRPAVFVMENVKGILSSNVKGKLIFDRILSDLRDPRYGNYRGCKYKIYSLVKKTNTTQNGIETLRPEDFIVECEKYGIPQARHRVILLGVREDIDCHKVNLLEPRPTVPIDSVINGLPVLRSGLSKEEDSPEIWRDKLRCSVNEEWVSSILKEIDPTFAEKLKEMLAAIECPFNDRGSEFLQCNSEVIDVLKWWYKDSRLDGICNHTTRGHMRTDIYRYIYASYFTSYFGSFPKLNQYPSVLQPEHKSAKSGHFGDRFRVQAYGRPATTITCHIAKDGHYYIHPDYTQCRSLTVREVARIQTFPDNYYFCGGRTSQYIQVGNAVPPLLAYQIARVVYGILNGCDNDHSISFN